ncbi:two-component sensor histidine kinase [Georgenia yuyongxinii]|uniref:histidine kinase n=2 Tax=Georgenia yuyongxinii TaxID=2589797 RepID=A0A5B8C7P5_9MICO|nr:histidine kinase [Georgenia yuyongxinii]QDC23946.1 two-component sensor histidine kinase [Georgenia yuyongxinii]
MLTGRSRRRASQVLPAAHDGVVVPDGPLIPGGVVVPDGAVVPDPVVLRTGPITRLLRRHPWWLDGLIAAVYVLLSVGDFLVERHLGMVRPPSGLILTAAFTVLVLLRRHIPVIGITVVGLAVPLHRLLVLGTARDPAPGDIFSGNVQLEVGTTSVAGYDLLTLALLLYAVAAYRNRTVTWLTFSGVGAAVAAAIFVFADQRSWLGELLGCTGVLLVATLIGLQVRSRRTRLFELEERARQLALERDQREQIAVSTERTRIAREMHDVVAHSIAVMITLAEGASAAMERRPEQARLALDELADTGRRALADTRRMVGVLREDHPPAVPSTAATADPLAPQPGAHDVADLVQRFRVTGLPVRLAESGPPLPGDTGLQLAVYRIVQECLTNVLRYARLSPRIDVTIARTPRSVGIVVDNDAGSAGTAVQGGGKGLIGMRERAAVYGGTVEAGPTETGWRVRAQLRWDEETR